MCGMVKPSFIPPEDIRQLRDLMRYRRKLTNKDLLSSVKARYVDFGDSGLPREMLSNINTPEDYARITGDL